MSPFRPNQSVWSCCGTLFDADNPVYNSQGVCYNSIWDMRPENSGKLDNVLIVTLVKPRNAPGIRIVLYDVLLKLG